jgi:hypothetical protein
MSTFIVPECEVNLSSIAGAYEILNRADNYWQKLGNNSKLVIQVAGLVPGLNSQEIISRRIQLR